MAEISPLKSQFTPCHCSEVLVDGSDLDHAGSAEDPTGKGQLGMPTSC